MFRKYNCEVKNMLIVDEYDLELGKSKDNYDIIKINKSGKQVYIGSKYNMQRELEKFILKVNDETKNIDKNRLILIIYGAGMGEHVKKIRELYKHNIIIVFEPNKKVFDIVKNISWINEDKEIFLICEESMKLKEILYDKLNLINISFTKIIAFSNYSNIYEEEYLEFLNDVKNVFTSNMLTRNTILLNSISWFHTFLNNLNFIIEGVPVNEFKGIYKNVPAIIVSAGPSLDKNIDDLKDVKNRMLVFSSPRTFEALMSRNIMPDLLVSADSGNKQYRMVRNFIKDYKNPVLFYELTNPKLMEICKNNEKIFFTISKSIDRIAENEVHRLEMGGSVAHFMTSFAIMLGCNPIIFIGQDFAYTDNKNYSESSENGDLINDVSESNEYFYVDGVNGKKVKTRNDLNIFRTELERKFIDKHKEIEFINATEGGARIKGTKEIQLKEVLKKYSGEKIKEFPKISYDSDMKKNTIDFLDELIRSIDTIIINCKESIELFKKLKKFYLIKKYNEINKTLSRLQQIDDLIINKMKSMDVINRLMSPLYYNILSSYMLDLDELGDLNLNKVSNIIEDNSNFYSAILDVVEYAYKFINKKIIDIKKIKE